MMHQLSALIRDGDFRALARGISFVENQVPGYLDLLLELNPEQAQPLIGITGPPGAGKSTITDALISHLVAGGKRVGIICIDPSSPFRHGALLGDRIRMREWYNHPSVFIRSLSSRGTMGGLNPAIIAITDLMKQFPFDIIFVETVGVGQTEVEIAGLADITVVVLVPESGDDVQNMKAGLMEAGDIFVVNKADRPGADQFFNNLRLALKPAEANGTEIPVIKTTATERAGTADLLATVLQLKDHPVQQVKKQWLMVEKAYLLIQERRMRGVDREILYREIEKQMKSKGFNLYRFAEQFDENPDSRNKDFLPKQNAKN